MTLFDSMNAQQNLKFLKTSFISVTSTFTGITQVDQDDVRKQKTGSFP